MTALEPTKSLVLIPNGILPLFLLSSTPSPASKESDENQVISSHLSSAPTDSTSLLSFRRKLNEQNNKQRNQQPNLVDDNERVLDLDLVSISDGPFPSFLMHRLIHLLRSIRIATTR